MLDDVASLQSSESPSNTDRLSRCIRVRACSLSNAIFRSRPSRFGLWERTLDLKHFADFIGYAAKVNSFLPRAVIPYVAALATVFETSFGILLILGLWPLWVSVGSAVLLAMFGTAMAISFGIESMDYSVFSASGASLLLALDALQRKSRGPG